MAGIFQTFGISFLFWLIVGCLRFVFETLHSLREKQHGFTTLNLVISSIAGVSISVSLFILFFFGLGPVDVMMTETAFPSFALSTLIVWLGCVSVGSYLATRIYMQRPYVVGGLVGFGAVLAGIIVLLLAQVEFALAPEALQWEAVWIAVTMLAAFLGGHVARALNALERERGSQREVVSKSARIKPEEVAVLIAAHNEELTIKSTIESVLQITSPKRIYIASDGSSDNTVKIVKELGCNVEDIQPNRGKARALTYMLKKYDLYDKYKGVLIMDADLKISKDYFVHMLAPFNDPETAATVSRAVPHWPRHYLPRWNMLVTAYRVQIWRILQFCVRYGQTWKHMNVTPIIPGGSSIYRTKILRKIDIDVPDLIIEDFNMTFEVHHKRLGKIAYCWNAIVIDQEPYSIRDFLKQIYRWYLGFWQTVRRHGPWFSFFWATMMLFALELGISSIAFILFPVYVALSLVDYFAPSSPLAGLMATEMTVYSVFIGIFVLEYIVSIFMAVLEKKPLMLVYGLFFLPLRYLEAMVFLYTLPRAFFGASSGTWKSPKRISYAEKTA